MDLVAQYYAQFAVEMEQVKKAVDTLDAKQNATKELVEGLQSQMRTLVQSNEAQMQALRTRLDELERQPKSSGGGAPPTLAEILERRSALAEIRAAGIGCGMARACLLYTSPSPRDS